MNNTPVDVIMRSHNDAKLIEATLNGLFKQNIPFQLTVFDNSSTDGTLDILKKFDCRIINVPAGTYIPGQILNRGMMETESELVAFLNSDCLPVNEYWLQNLLNGFHKKEKVAAVFGQQEPRPDCQTLFARDTINTFSDGAKQKYWKHCFSMASSAISRSVWKEMPFSEELRYSEDIDWTWRARQKGYEIAYIPESRVLHSHNYTISQAYRRSYGEGRAEADIFIWNKWESSILRYTILPLLKQIAADKIYALKKGAFADIFYAPILRTSQALGRRKGFIDGIKAKKARNKPTDANE
jgi:rhamnosyltransferase